MRKIFVFLLPLLIMPVCAYGGLRTGTLSSVVMQPNDIVENACNFETLGIHQGTVYMQALYSPKEYTCEPGEYLPVNEDGCTQCPKNSWCPGNTGGTPYVFSETQDQGINACPDGRVSHAGSANESDCGNYITCEAGEYLVANSNECAPCLENHYCGGGDFIPSNADDGITACADGLVSPVGTSAAAHCGRILHVGDDVVYLTSVKQTSPALAVRMDDGAIYYAKMSPVSNGLRRMNVNADNSFRVNVNGTEYYIHDNTIKGE